jgi:hypothetical protein
MRLGSCRDSFVGVNIAVQTATEASVLGAIVVGGNRG